MGKQKQPTKISISRNAIMQLVCMETNTEQKFDFGLVRKDAFGNLTITVT
jgi:hypothetical protein